jgi:tetratricopeptide (TPR) repeat protein
VRRLRRVACLLILLTALAAPAPAPSGDAFARGQMEAAIALEQSGRYREAIEQLSRAIAAKTLSDADTARALFDRGVAYDGLGNMRAAVADYSAALRLDADLAPALNNRANAFRRAGRLVEAKRDYWAALKCPSVAREYSYNGLGLITVAEGDRDAARGYFQKALAVNPNFGPAAQSLAALMDPAAPPETKSAEAPAEKKPAAATGAVLVQLGAFQNEVMARAAWDKIAAASEDALRGFTPVTVPVDLPGKGRLWRLRTAVSDITAARKLCLTLLMHRQACVLARH